MMASNRIYILLISLLLLGVFSGCSDRGSSLGEPVDQNGVDSESVQQTDDQSTILILGDSIAAGYGLDKNEAFPALLQQKVDSSGLNYKVVNAGLSGDTSSGGLSRIDWLLRQEVSVFILELGANDGLRGIDLELTQRNLDTILKRVVNTYPDAKLVIAGMQVPPNLGSDYTTTFRNMYPQLADSNDAVLIPFVLESVAGIPDLNQADRIHPTSEGHEIIGNTVWHFLEPLLKSGVDQKQN